MLAETLVTQAVKLAYEKWKDSKTASLALSDHAKVVLAQMQSDPTDEGIFRWIRFLGPAAPKLCCVYHTEIEMEVRNRVMSELEAKGLVTIESDSSGGGDLVKLTHFGWILNPETGKADKVG